MRFTIPDITSAGSLTYKWQLNDADLSDRGGISGTTTDTLTIASVGKSDEGMYKCVVSKTAVATSTSNAVQMTVRKCSIVSHFLCL